jgi:hypothetical protein
MALMITSPDNSWIGPPVGSVRAGNSPVRSADLLSSPCVIFWTLKAERPVPRALRADWFGPETSIQPLEVRASNLIGDHCRK